MVCGERVFWARLLGAAPGEGPPPGARPTAATGKPGGR